MNKTQINDAAYGVAEQADAIEVDIIHAVDEDDIMAVLSHVEILERRTANLKAALRAILEGATAEVESAVTAANAISQADFEEQDPADLIAEGERAVDQILDYRDQYGV